jgi:hypothetical protein
VTPNATSKQRRMFVPAYAFCTIQTRKRMVRVVSQRGVWCINTALPLNGDGYNVTHLPTKFAALTGVSLAIARKAIKDFAALKGDWTFSKPEQMTPQQKQAGTRIRDRWRKAADK